MENKLIKITAKVTFAKITRGHYRNYHGWEIKKSQFTGLWSLYNKRGGYVDKFHTKRACIQAYNNEYGAL